MDSYRYLFRAQDELKRLASLSDPVEIARMGIQRMMGQDLASAAYASQRIADDWRDSLLQDAFNPIDHSFGDLRSSLLDLRAEMLLENQLANAITHVPRNFFDAQTDLARRQMEHLTSFAQVSDLTETFSERLASSIDQQALDQIADLTRPFHRIHTELWREASGLTDIADAAGWARRLGVQTIDAASVATVARVWGAQDTLRILRELSGIDLEALGHIASMLDVEPYEDDDDTEEGEETLGQRRIRVGRTLSLSEIAAILSILLTLVSLYYTFRSTTETEKRLRADNHALSEQVQQSEQRIEQQIEQAFSRLASNLIQHAQPATGVQFVVRSRGAVIKSEKSGGTVVAEALPGQVVTLIAKEGKWIEISYFDFATQELQAGWALKKYFVRVKVEGTPDGE